MTESFSPRGPHAAMLTEPLTGAAFRAAWREGELGGTGSAVVEEAVLMSHYPSPGETENHRHQGQAPPHDVTDGE